MRKLTLTGFACLLFLPLFLFGLPESALAQIVTTSTPKSDGSIIHIVQSGESLISIAEAYGVSVEEIKALNNLSSDEIFAGEKLIIRPAATPTPTATATSTATETPEPTSTRRPTRTPTDTPHPASSDGLNGTSEALQPGGENNSPDQTDNILIGAIITLGVLGVGMMIVGGLMRRESKRNGL